MITTITLLYPRVPKFNEEILPSKCRVELITYTADDCTKIISTEMKEGGILNIASNIGSVGDYHLEFCTKVQCEEKEVTV